MKISRNRKGFTLLEILIVIVILGVVAALAIPAYTANVFKSHSSEAIQTLQVVKNFMFQYHQANGTYVGATYATIGYDPNAVAGGQIRHFDYAAPGGLGATTWTITAACEDTAVAGVSKAITGCAPAADTIVMNAEGIVTRNGKFA